MSILKSILHRYNTTSQDYDTLHPETEYAQVTDFGQGVIAHLASSTLVSLVTSVSTGSVFGKMVEKLLEASGVQYNFQNSNAWYICLGSLFGGLIIQGGYQSSNQTVTLPVTYSSSRYYSANVTHLGSDANTIFVIASSDWTESSFKLLRNNNSAFNYFWLTVGR